MRIDIVCYNHAQGLIIHHHICSVESSKMPYSRIREAPESSSAATLRAVVAALTDAWHAPQHITPTEKRFAQMARHLPEWAIKKAVARAVRQRALEPDLARFVKTEGLARQVIAHYQHVQNRVGYPALIIGAPNGGVAYLAALLDTPFLPSHFLLSFADHSDPDDIATYHSRGAQLIDTILNANPDLLAVNHYDPIHDRFLVEEVNHIRLKLLELPEAYQKFIQNHLAPGGTIFYVDNRYTWHQYRVNDRHMFQVGGLGGFSDEEYIEGSEVISAWLAEQNSEHRGGWQLAGYDLEIARESEWGGLPEFREAVKHFATEMGYQFKAINGEHPEDFSALAYTAFLWERRLHDVKPNGILVECFSQINPTAALRSAFLPLWMPFNTQDSLDYFTRMTPYLPKDLPVGISLLPGFTKTPDLPAAQAWQEAGEKIGPVRWIGVNPDRYPMDISAIFDYAPDLQQWVQEFPRQSPRPRLSPEELLDMMTYLTHHGSRLFTYLLNIDTEEGETPFVDDPPAIDMYDPTV